MLSTAQLPPLWTKINSGQKLSGLNIFTPLYLKTQKNDFGGGDIKTLYKLVDMAAWAGFSLIQFNPIHDSGNWANPYKAISLFSYNPVFLSLDDDFFKGDFGPSPRNFPDFIKNQKDTKGNFASEDFSSDGTLLKIPHDFGNQDQNIVQTLGYGIFNLLKKERNKQLLKESLGHFHYRHLRDFKLKALQIIYPKFKDGVEFGVWLKRISKNQVDYAVFLALQKKYGQQWQKWPEDFKLSSSFEIIKKHEHLQEDINFNLFTQWVLQKQWQKLADYANSKGVYLYLDKPIYPDINSADVWANKDLFYLNKDGSPQFVSGCFSPGDPFGQQVWGQAVYRFDTKSQEVINFYLKNIKFLSQIAQVIHLDHTLALVWKYYLVDPQTQKGKHKQALGDKLLQNLKQEFPDIYFIAEDVGYISEFEVDLPLKENGIPGLRCLQWSNPKYQQISNYSHFCVAMTSNHDTQSLSDWWDKINKKDKEKIWQQVNDGGSLNKIKDQELDDLINLVFSSKASVAIIPLQDILHDNRRYNLPGVESLDNWSLRSGQVLEKIDFGKITQIIAKNRRLPQSFENIFIATNPLKQEIQKRRAGEFFVLEIAVTKLPEKIEIFTNLPTSDNLSGGNWQTYIYHTYDFNIKNISELKICELDMLIPIGAKKGSYELAASLYFPNNQINLCQPSDNYKLEIW